MKLNIYRGESEIKVENKINPKIQELHDVSKNIDKELNSREFAKYMDENDELKNFREKFHFPKHKDQQVLYFVGNSLGLQPKKTEEYLNKELSKWKNIGVRGHFETEKPWFNYEDFAIDMLSRVVGAKPSEVAVMNTLTTNLHLLMVPFYRPTSKRFKILIEENPFPSDMFAVQSQIKYHGYNVEDSLLIIGPRKGEHTIRTQDIEELIEKEGDSIELVLLTGVQFLTGQAFEMEKIVKIGHSKGCIVGFDLAHAVGNLEIFLHDWNVDFACFCSYKYLNSGPGSIAGIFVHEKHKDIGPKFEGWWGNKRENRFSMKTEFDSQLGAASFQLSNPSIFALCPLVASLEIFDEATMKKLRQKSQLLTTYLEHLIKTVLKEKCQILTPLDISQRGCQLSIRTSMPIKEVYQKLEDLGVDVDKREPDVLRISPVPLYNSFTDVFELIQILEKLLNQ